MPQFIGHVDADCFYVSAERVRLPHLRGMPVGVLGNHGACIIAKSYEMKASGVTTGMPIWEALPLCPDGVYVKRDFTWYETLSRQLLAVVKSISQLVEYYSIDEMFFSVTQPSVADARDLQTHVLARLGVPVSVGIAPTKTLAKLASDANKPYGYHVVGDENARLALLQDMPVTEITGVAHRSAAKLAGHGITTCDQFAKADRRLIRKLLTKRGEDLWWELNGDSVIPIAPKRPRHKFISRGGSLGRATADRDRLKAFVV
ncbi:MAG: nucleotidyltransferase, partial [Planctomycetaceae bacterium]